jgi:hypothetical protein
MKTHLFLASLLLASSALATTTSSCQTGSMMSYLVSGFGCQSGSLTFSGFDYRGTGPSASSITVSPLSVFDNEGFQFQGGWSVSSQNGISNSQEAHISYTVQHVGSLIDTLSLSFGSSVTGTGIASVTEQFCLGYSLDNCPHVNQGLVEVTNPGSGFSNRAFFAGVSSIAVSKDILLISGTNGAASISHVTDTFSSPEPLSFVLLGTGLLGIGLMRRRLNRR